MHYRRHPWEGRRGFTLLELLVVIVILVILMMILLPEFLQQSVRARDARAKSYLTLAWQDLTVTATADEANFTSASELAGELRYDDPSLSTQVVSDCSASTMAGFNDKTIAIVGPQSNGAALVMCVRSSSGDIIELIGPVTGADPTIVLVSSISGQKPINIAAPTISGDVRYGQQLTAQEGGWESDTPPVYSYQWQRCNSQAINCINVAGGTSRTYLVLAGDVGSRFKVLVTATNETGSATATSAPTGTANTSLAGLPDNTSLPTISGAAAQGQTVTADKGTWTGDVPISYACQWQDSSDGVTWHNIAGATSCSYSIPAAEVGKQLLVEVKASNKEGEQDSYSAPTDAVIPPPASTAAPTLAGYAQDTQILSTSDGSWQYSPTSYTYQWQFSSNGGATWNAIAGATASSYQIPYGTYDGDELRCRVTATNAAGSTSASSNSSAVVVAVPPTNTAAPTFSGTAQVGQQLTGTHGSWNGTPTISYSYQWQSSPNGGNSWTALGGATSSSYTVQASDAGNYLRLEVTASNAGGLTSADSAASSQMLSAIPVAAVVPYAGQTPLPSGWALADGACGYTSTSYPDLWAAIGTTYGGTGSSNFCLPDMRGKMALGKSSSGTGSALGQTGSAFDKSGVISLGAFTYNFSWTDTPPNPAFSASSLTWCGTGCRNVSTYGSGYYNTNISPATLTATQSGSVTGGANVSASGRATVSTIYSATNPPYLALRYIVEVSASASTPCGAIWSSALPSAPSGAVDANGASASGSLSSCLATAFGGNVPDMRGSFAVGQATSGTAASLGARGGALSQTATVSYASGTGVANVTPPGWSVNLQIVSPTPSASYSSHSVEQAGGSSGFDAASSPSRGSDDGSVIGSSVFSPGSIATGGAPSGSAATSTYTAPYLALNQVVFTASSYTPAPGLITPYVGASAPAGWLIANGQAVSRSTYSSLFAAIGTTYGSGDGSTTFNLPDLAGRIALGRAAAGTGSALGSSGGALDATPSATLPGWTPTLTIPAHSFTWSLPNFTYTYTGRRNSASIDGTGTGGSGSFQIAQSTDCPGNNPCSETYTSQGGGAQTVTSTSGQMTVNAAPIGAQPVTLPAQNAPYLSVTYIIK